MNADNFRSFNYVIQNGQHRAIGLAEYWFNSKKKSKSEKKKSVVEYLPFWPAIVILEEDLNGLDKELKESVYASMRANRENIAARSDSLLDHLKRVYFDLANKSPSEIEYIEFCLGFYIYSKWVFNSNVNKGYCFKLGGNEFSYFTKLVKLMRYLFINLTNQID